MNYESAAQALSSFDKRVEQMRAYSHAMGVMALDASTAAPRLSAEGRGRTYAVLSQVRYELMADPENGALLAYLESHEAELSQIQKRAVQLFRRQYEQLRRIPMAEYVDYEVLLNDSQAKWEEAKNKADFSIFQPYLEKIVGYNRKFAVYYDAEKAPYDALLNEYERGLTMETLDKFFGALKDALVPLIAKVKAAPAIDSSFLSRFYPASQQEKLSYLLMDALDIDKDRCTLAETEHPFTTEFNNHDVRITTHYYENALASSMYSVIHEGGHAIYELDCDDRYNYTLLSGGVSMGIHESQSRFYENILGRSRPFLSYLFPKVKELFPEQLQDVDEELFYRAVNKAEPSLVRTEADELTYCMHIIIRYELEKRLLDGSLAVRDLPEAWNRLYRDYLGIDVPNDKAGCLQDSHWSNGLIGYFPSYALGSAYGAQMLACMERDLGDIWPRVSQGDLSHVRSWLKEHIHKYASLYEPDELFRRACGEFDPKYYIDYLEEKYSRLYNLK